MVFQNNILLLKGCLLAKLEEDPHDHATDVFIRTGSLVAN